MRISILINVGELYLRIPDFMDQFVENDNGLSSRQSTDLSDQLVPVFLITFLASLMNSFHFMGTGTATDTTEAAGGE